VFFINCFRSGQNVLEDLGNLVMKRYLNISQRNLNLNPSSISTRLLKFINCYFLKMKIWKGQGLNKLFAVSVSQSFTQFGSDCKIEIILFIFLQA
jgi:hypothetical protein